MDDHPGGDDVLMQVAGKDATEEFDDVGHSKSAIEQLKDFYVGECPEVLEKKISSVAATNSKLAASDGPTLTNSVGIFSKVLQFLVPLVLLGVAVALRKYGKKDLKN
ncbi:hypothetical protein KC19_11G027300 [Ceratodon purpureus]|nr:hypothetical protein KC19_11G027300 [Ceratodon purpureus]